LRDRRAGFLLAALSLLVAGCPTDEPVPDDDDDDDVVVDDDDSATPDDDDLTPSSDDDDSAAPSLVFDPSQVGAGEVLDIDVTLLNFDTSLGSLICCDQPAVQYWRTVYNDGETVIFRFFFGLFGQGHLSWGLDNQFEIVVGWFDVEPLAEPITQVMPGAPAAPGEIDALRGFDVFSFEVTEGDSLVHIQASNPSNDVFHPWLLLLDDDGAKRLELRGGRFEDGTFETPLIAFRAPWPATYYVRVQDFFLDTGGYDLDLSIAPPEPPEQRVEVEPNDEPEDWQDLGLLAGGEYELDGVAATAGHDPDDQLSGDLDVFRFEVEHESLVHFALWWSSSDDLDALLFDDRDGGTILTQDQAIDGQMATGSLPQEGDYQLEAGVPYVLEIGSFEGDPEEPWTMLMDVIPRHFPEDPVGDDDDSAGDDDDSAGDDDDSAR
jgi:hypothetical protein